MCINYVHSDRFLIPREAFFVQCSYAMPVLLRSVSSHNQTAADGFIGNGVGGGRDSARQQSVPRALRSYRRTLHRVAEDAETGSSRNPGYA